MWGVALNSNEEKIFQYLKNFLKKTIESIILFYSFEEKILVRKKMHKFVERKSFIEKALGVFLCIVVKE